MPPAGEVRRWHTTREMLQTAGAIQNTSGGQLRQPRK
jgi:hypothetical protein